MEMHIGIPVLDKITYSNSFESRNIMSFIIEIVHGWVNPYRQLKISKSSFHIKYFFFALKLLQGFNDPYFSFSK